MAKKYRMTDQIKNVQALKQELLRVADSEEIRNLRLFSLALAYLLSELCPHDRTTKHVVEEARK